VRAASEEQEAEGASFKYTDEGEPHSSLVKVVSLDFAGTLVSQDMMDYFWLEVVPLLYSKRHGIWLSEAKDEVYGAYEQVGKTDVRWYSPRYWFERFGLADQLGLTVEERDLPREALYTADEVFMTGTAAEITPVRSVDRKPVGNGTPGPVTRALREAFFGLFDGRTRDRWGWLDVVRPDTDRAAGPGQNVTDAAIHHRTSHQQPASMETPA